MVGDRGCIITGDAIIGAVNAVAVGIHGETMPVGMQVVGTRSIELPYMIP